MELEKLEDTCQNSLKKNKKLQSNADLQTQLSKLSTDVETSNK